jgi:hypothetical protein
MARLVASLLVVLTLAATVAAEPTAGGLPASVWAERFLGDDSWRSGEELAGHGLWAVSVTERLLGHENPAIRVRACHSIGFEEKDPRSASSESPARSTAGEAGDGTDAWRRRADTSQRSASSERRWRRRMRRRCSCWAAWSPSHE